MLDSFLCRYKKLSGTIWTAAAHTRQTGFSLTLNIVPEQLAERVCCLDSSYSLLNVYFRLIWFKSLLLLIYLHYVPNNLSRGGYMYKNLSNMWRSRVKICLAQLHSVTEMALKSLFCLVADPGEGPRGPFPLPLIIFRPDWWPKENAPLPLSQGLDDPPPPSPAWRYGSATAVVWTEAQSGINIALASLFLSGPWIISVWQNSCNL